MKFTQIGLKALVLSTAALIAAPALAEAEFKFTLHHFLGPQSNAHKDMLVPWAESIEKASDGRIDIEVYPSMSLGGAPPQLFRQAVDGVADIIWMVNGYTPGLFPRTEVFELPGVVTHDIAAANLAMSDLFDQYLAEEYKGVKVLWLHVHAGNGLHMAGKKVTSLADFKGLSLRSPGPSSNAVIEALGATPVSMPVPDLPQSLATNHVQGGMIPWEIIPALQLQQSTDYQIEGPNEARFSGTAYQVSMNQDSWDSLPPDLQQIILDNTGPDFLKKVADIWRKSDDDALALAVADGNEHVVIEQAAWDEIKAALDPVDQKWIADNAGTFDAQALYDAAKAAIAAHSK